MYPVSDIAKSRDFYERVLGFEQGGLHNEHWIEYELDGTTFGIADFPQAGKPGTALSFAIEVPDMTAFRSQLKDLGLGTMDPYEGPGCFISMVSDPDGNQIWLHQAKA